VVRPARLVWVQPLQGDNGVSGRDQRHVVVPTTEAAALEVVKTKAVFELAVVVLDAPAQLGQPDQLLKRGVLGQAGQPVLDRLGLVGGHSASSQRTGSSPPATARRSFTPAGRTPRATNRERSLPRVPSRQATVLTAAGPAAVTSSASEDRLVR
jgi:hypothetical protein